jgi:hypothetical protein
MLRCRGVGPAGVTRRTAHEHEPVSACWLITLVRDRPITIAQLREDRLIEEAVADGADPLHIASMSSCFVVYVHSSICSDGR